jgi:hypothetical protein
MQSKKQKLVTIQIKNIDPELRERARRVAIHEGYYSINDVIRMFLYDYAQKYINMRRYWLGGANPAAQQVHRQMDETNKKNQDTQTRSKLGKLDRDFDEIESVFG